jgi:hypothetical protein
MKKNIYMNVTSGDIRVDTIMINSILSSAIVILGDAETITPRSVTISKGVLPPEATPVGGIVGPGTATGAIGVVPV